MRCSNSVNLLRQSMREHPSTAAAAEEEEEEEEGATPVGERG